jgi:hypothetical protein
VFESKSGVFMTGPRNGRRLFSGIVVALLATATLVAVSSSPAAAANPCTSRGYGSPSRYHSDYPSTEEGPAGTAYIYYRSTAPTNCALFYSNEPGAATTQSIRVCLERRSDGAKECDPPARGSGPYHTYAGPVFINAPGVCVKVYGTVDPTQGRSETVNSDWVRCR